MSEPVRIVLTREQNSNQAWATRLEQAGLAWLAMPLVRFAPLPVPADVTPAGFDWVLLTSPQGVRALAERYPEPGTARIAVLGHGTARAVTEAGWTVAFDAGALDGAEFGHAFLRVAGSPGTVLLPGPRRRLTEPRATLEKAGYTVQELPLYETLPTAASAIAAVPLTANDVVFFCSPSAVRAYCAARNDKPRCVAIGRTTAEACRTAGMNPAVAETPDLDSMVRAAGLPGLVAQDNGTVKPELET